MTPFYFTGTNPRKSWVPLIEHHEADCTCSYCKAITPDYRPMHWGLNIPPQWWGWNSWYCIKFGRGRYIRLCPFWFLRRWQVKPTRRAAAAIGEKEKGG